MSEGKRGHEWPTQPNPARAFTWLDEAEHVPAITFQRTYGRARTEVVPSLSPYLIESTPPMGGTKRNEPDPRSGGPGSGTNNNPLRRDE